MWTKNYKNLCAYRVLCCSYGYNGVATGEISDTYFGNFKDGAGNIREFCTYNTHNSYAGSEAYLLYRNSSGTLSTSCSTIRSQTGSLSASDLYKFYVAFGSSNTAETELDYKLESIISKYTEKSVTTAVSANDDGSYNITCNIIIEATAAFDINEIGLFKAGQYYATSNYSSYNYPMLINRIVLPNTISAAAGDVVKVTFTITTPKFAFN